MHRVRQNTRIRPVRPQWSRTKVVRLVAALLVAAAVFGTGWLQRTEARTVALSPTGPYRVRSATGPIEVTAGHRAAVHYNASWLINGPTATAEAGDVVLRCETSWPCRASSTVVLPEAGGRGPELELHGDGEDLLITEFAGVLTASTVGDADVLLGPIAGSVVARTEQGAVFGHGLLAREVEVETESGRVELGFGERPARVAVTSGDEPVTITLPPGDYAVNVVGGSSITIGVGQAADADSRITIQARGPVRIDPAR